MINIDTTKIKNCGEDIVKLSEDLNVLLDDLYSKLDEIYKKGVWVGNSSISYMENVKLEKQQMLNLQSSLYNIGNTFILNATKYEDIIKESIL